MNRLKLLLQEDAGLELSEYAIAAGLVVIPLTVAITDLGSQIAAAVDGLTGWIQSS
ncbi:MAG: hypothetical protein HYR56_30135 [Acidobacteria bacterium]|nr:hypothetical protein [Acidobacteriota bacterium]MBI3423678.1 hypothetical protein [Acidobacteriota bacterium]